MRGSENPHTSASTTATDRSRPASAIARFAVTDDFPTPPFPDAIASTRVLVSVNGFTRARGAAPPARVRDRQRIRRRFPLQHACDRDLCVVGHLLDRDVDAVRARRLDASSRITRRRNSFQCGPSGQGLARSRRSPKPPSLRRASKTTPSTMPSSTIPRRNLGSSTARARRGSRLRPRDRARASDRLRRERPRGRISPMAIGRIPPWRSPVPMPTARHRSPSTNSRPTRSPRPSPRSRARSATRPDARSTSSCARRPAAPRPEKSRNGSSCIRTSPATTSRS